MIFILVLLTVSEKAIVRITNLVLGQVVNVVATELTKGCQNITPKGRVDPIRD